MSREKDLKSTLAQAVSFTIGNQRGRKSKGTKIGEKTNDLAIVKIKPFSK